jgi:hypothetical protein
MANSKYTIRLELHGASEQIYEQLHQQMEKNYFKRYIIVDSGKYELPFSEYTCDGNGDADTILEKVLYIARKICKKHKLSEPTVLVTKTVESRKWYNLKKIG